MGDLENRVLEQYYSIYPKHIDKFDKQAKKFDYYDMIEFAETVAKKISNDKLDEGVDKSIRNLLISFLDSIRDYEHENGSRITTDDRESSEFVDIFLESPDASSYKINDF